jgi:hypothetical protein
MVLGNFVQATKYLAFEIFLVQVLFETLIILTENFRWFSQLLQAIKTIKDNDTLHVRLFSFGVYIVLRTQQTFTEKEPPFSYKIVI